MKMNTAQNLAVAAAFAGLLGGTKELWQQVS